MLSLRSSRTSSTTHSRPLWDPRSILRIDDDDDCCVGYAASKGRKCQNRIAYANLGNADNILRDISMRQPDADALETKLRRLSECLLCVRWHRDQVWDVVEEWMDRIDEEFPDGLVPVVETPRRQGLLEPSTSASSRRAASSPPTSSPAHPQRPSRRTTSSYVSLPEHSELGTLQETIATMQETLRVAQRRLAELEYPAPPVRASPTISRVSTSDISSLDLSRRSTARSARSAPARPQSPNADRTCTGNHVRRRPIDEECPVCTNPMVTGGELRLAWCRNECGKSLHAECFEAWKRISGSATCVNCRAEWAPDCECEE